MPNSNSEPTIPQKDLLFTSSKNKSNNQNKNKTKTSLSNFNSSQEEAYKNHKPSTSKERIIKK